MPKSQITMDELLAQSDIANLDAGDITEGIVTSIKKHEIWLDLGPNGVGVILRREASGAVNLEVGQKLTVSVIDPEYNDDGDVLLSMRRVAKDQGWEELERIFKEREIIDIVPYEANRGGLLVEYEGIRGFLPVSQLSAKNYPRIGNADKDEIMHKITLLVGQTLRVRILDALRKENKLIFSEKEAVKDDTSQKLAKLTVGDIVKGKVTGVIDFGAFVNVDGIEGLIHISEISWERIDDPRKYLKVNQDVEAKIIAIDKDRLSLSLKQLMDDPWLGEVSKFKVNDEIEGKITRITPFGAFVQLSPNIEALVHVSEMSDDETVDPEKIFQLNETKLFTLIDIDLENRKISLSLKKPTLKKKSASKEKSVKSEDEASKETDNITTELSKKSINTKAKPAKK